MKCHIGLLLLLLLLAARPALAQPQAMQLPDTSGGQLLALATDWKDDQVLVPVSKEQLAAQEHQRAKKAREAQMKGRLTLSLQARGGFIWLADGLGQDRSESTTMKGLGLRIGYGFNRFVGVDAEAMGASTGTARFEDTSLNGMQGELQRSGSLGRVQGGVAVRLGRRTIPVLRAGVGVQGASVGSRFVVDGRQVPGPESSFRISGLWYLGGGVDFRLGSHFLAGAELLYEHDDTPSFEGMLHIAYDW